MKYRRTSPSRYYERQTAPHLPVVMEYRQHPIAENGEYVAVILGAIVWGFALGMIAAAAMAGVL